MITETKSKFLLYVCFKDKMFAKDLFYLQFLSAKSAFYKLKNL